MNIISKLFDFIMHIDKYLGSIIQNYGTFSYFILFLIIFLETGLVITPFLPGDSLIFVAGTFAAKNVINVYLLFLILIVAAILGDTFNYWIGNYFGENVFSKSRFFKKEYLDKTKEFYDKYGGKTIILARFIPIIRTFAPFVAGIGKMNYFRFLVFNISGGVFWVALFLFGGYFFGNIKFVQDNLSLVVLAIILLSLIPPIIEFLKRRKTRVL
ncbi:DedA family protein [Candidatus Woesearchaeota archaeon]|nr:DedA family protein [Candidatus Woesearchaeota archaeon]